MCVHVIECFRFRGRLRSLDFEGIVVQVIFGADSVSLANVKQTLVLYREDAIHIFNELSKGKNTCYKSLSDLFNFKKK